MALVGNKDDMYEMQEVTYDEGLAFAKELNQTFMNAYGELRRKNKLGRNRRS